MITKYKELGEIIIFKSRLKKLLIFGLSASLIASSLAGAQTVEAKTKTKLKCLGRYKITYYCPCESCSGGWGSQTALGVKAKAGRTIAVDKKYIKLKTKVKINGHWYRAEDVGGGVKGKHIDIYVAKHSDIPKEGVNHFKVYKKVKVKNNK